MVNRVVVVGRLTRVPELKKTQTGKSLLNFTVAVNRRFSQDQTDFINCVAWERTADFIANYLTKGSLVSVEGSIQSRSYEDQTGKKVFVQEVNAENVNSLESRAQRQEREQNVQPYQSQNNYQQTNKSSGYQPDFEPSFSIDDEPVLDITSDDLPF